MLSLHLSIYWMGGSEFCVDDSNIADIDYRKHWFMYIYTPAEIYDYETGQYMETVKKTFIQIRFHQKQSPIKKHNGIVFDSSSRLFLQKRLNRLRRLIAVLNGETL